MHQFFPPKRPANGQPTIVVFVSKVLEWNNVLAANMPIFTCFLENKHRVGGWNWRFEDVVTVLVIRGLNRFLFDIQQGQTSDVHNLHLAHFFKPNVEPDNNKCTTHLSVFWYEHLLKHGWGLSRRGCVSCSFFFQTDID